jgi:hypothetical protein
MPSTCFIPPPTPPGRYIQFLEADLAEFGANDTRSLYYLGVGYLDLFNALRGNGHVLSDPSSVPQEAWDALSTSVGYYNRRVAIVGVDQGTMEERWFAMVKLGEIHERFYHNPHIALRYYLQNIRLDPVRADGWFYAAQILRLHGRNRAALPLAVAAVKLPEPDRALFHWKAMYYCLPHMEVVRATLAIPVTEAEVAAGMKEESSSVLRTGYSVADITHAAGPSEETPEEALAASWVPSEVARAIESAAPHLTKPFLRSAIACARSAARHCGNMNEAAVVPEAQQAVTTLEARLKEWNRIEARLKAKRSPAATSAGHASASKAPASASHPPSAIHPPPVSHNESAASVPRDDPMVVRIAMAAGGPAAAVWPAPGAPGHEALVRRLLGGVRDALGGVDVDAIARHLGLPAGSAPGAVTVDAVLLQSTPPLPTRLKWLQDTVATTLAGRDAGGARATPLQCADVRAVLRQWRECAPVTGARLPGALATASGVSRLCSVVADALATCTTRIPAAGEAAAPPSPRSHTATMSVPVQP